MEYLNNSHTNNSVYFNSTYNLYGHDDYQLYDDVPLEAANMVIWVVRMGITGFIAVFGIITNTLNIVIFYRQGILLDSCTVSLAGLAVADFCYCLFTVWNSICTSLFQDLIVDHRSLPFYVFRVWVITAYRPQVLLTQIVCYLTTYLTFQRFFTVMFPFKAKFVLTANRSLVTVSGIIIITILLNFTQYAGYMPVMVFRDRLNDTIFTYVPSGLVTDENNKYIYVYPSIIGLRLLSITALLVFNSIIHWKVKLSAQFRKSVSVSAPTKPTSGKFTQDACSQNEKKTKNADSENDESKAANASTQKEVKLQRMLLVISTFFLVCYIPDTISNSFFILNEYSLRGLYFRYIEMMVACCTQLLQTINSSCNLIIYYTMSSRYRQELLLCLANRRN